MVSRYFGFLSSRFPRRNSETALAFFWVAGLLCGFCLFQGSGSFLPEAVTVTVSAGGLFIRVLVPFLVCLVGMLLDQHWLVFGCAFCKAVLLSFVSLCAMAAFGSGGWLVRFLLLFTDTLMCTVWYGFWLDCLSDKRICPANTMFFCAAGFFVACIDLRVITPLLMRIINC